MRGMRYQPQSAVRLNAEHPLRVGLAEVWLPGVGSRGMISGTDSSAVADGSIKGTPRGVGFNCTSTGRRYSTTILNGQPFAWLVLAHRRPDAANCSIVRKDGTATPMQEWDGQVRAAFFNGGGGFAGLHNYGPVADFADRVSTFCGTVNESERVIFSNGGPSIAASAAPAVAGPTTHPFCIGATEGGGEVASNWTVLAVFLWQGAQIPSSGQLRTLEANPWQLFAARDDDDDVTSVISDTALAGAAAAVASASGALSTSIRLAGSGTATASTAGALSTAIRLTGAAQAQASAAGTLATAIRLTGAAQATAAATGTLSTSIRLTGVASALATAAATLAGGGAGLSGAATATATGTGVLTTGIPLTGAAYAQASAAGALTTRIALAGAAVASATAAGTLAEPAPPAGIVDVSKISPARIVVFDGSGSRVVPFEGSGSRVVLFEGSGSRVVVFEGSGARVRIDAMSVSAKEPVKIDGKWVVDRDPDEKSYYLADLTQELIDRATTAVSVELVLVGVVQVEPPSIQTVDKDSVQRTYAVAFLGGTELEPPEGWKWVARVTCANGERFDKTTWFNKVDP